MARRPLPPLVPGWLVVDGLPMYHRHSVVAGRETPAVVHVHGFGISGTYLEPTAALLARHHRTYVPDLPGAGRSMRPDRPLDIPGLARSLASYLDAVGIERATFVGNSLGCPLIVELGASFPERVEGAVLVSPAGGPNNQPLLRAIGQLALDGGRERLSMVPIAVRDYLHFGFVQSLALFGAMTRYPTLDRLHLLSAPTLVIAGRRDPLVKIGRAHLLASLPHVRAVEVPGAHALNYSDPGLISALVLAHLSGAPLRTPEGVLSVVNVLDVRGDNSPTM